MEIITLAVIAGVAYIIYLGSKFTNFKSKLMNEFGRHGIPFEVADALFTKERDDINSMYHSGMPVDQIVNRYLKRADSMHMSVPFADLSVKKQYYTERANENDNKTRKIVDFVSKSLSIQQALFINEDGNLPKSALDEWSIGYVAGTADAVLQMNEVATDIEGMSIMTYIFIEVFGEENGPQLFGEFMRLQKDRHQNVQKGMMKGGQDIMGWMKDTNQIPTSWMAYVHGHDAA